MLENRPEQSSDQGQPKSPVLERRRARQKRVEQLIKLLGPLTGAGIGGFGGFVTAKLLITGQFQAAMVSVLLTIAVVFLAVATKFVAELINLVLDKSEEKLEQLEEMLAKLIVNYPENRFRSFQFQREYYKYLFYIYRNDQPENLTSVSSTPELEKVFVPLKLVSKSPRETSPAIIKKQSSLESLSIWDFLAAIYKQSVYKRMVVLGPPGSGKTTLLKHLTLTYAQNTQRRQNRKTPKLIPVLLYLRQIREAITNSQPPNLAQLVTEHLKSPEFGQKLDPPSQWFENLLMRGKCLVMLDGLDEVADESQRQQVSQWIDKQIQRYPETTFILTSRPHGYRNAELKEVGICLEIQPFNFPQMKQFINKWHLQNEALRQPQKTIKKHPEVPTEAERKAKDLINRIKKNDSLAAMALNPLLLRMIVTVHDNGGILPRSRAGLYAEICEVLIARRQESKGLSDPIQLKVVPKQSLLQVLALELMKQKTRDFDLLTGKKIIQNQLEAMAGRTLGVEDFLKHIEQVSGLLVKNQQDRYEFAHQSFQEYLAAAQVKETSQENLLIENIHDIWWHETIRLYVADNNATNLIRAAMENPSTWNLAFYYLDEGKEVDPDLRKQLEDCLKAQDLRKDTRYRVGLNELHTNRWMFEFLNQAIREPLIFQLVNTLSCKCS